MDSSVKKATDDDRCVAQIIAICLGTRCPPRDPSLLVSCSPVPHHVIPEGPLEGHNSFKSEMKICFADSSSTIDGEEFGFVGKVAFLSTFGTTIELFCILKVDAAVNPSRFYFKQLLRRVSNQYDIENESLEERIMAVLDYISGMTDIYALDIYQEINGISLPIV